MPFPSFDKLIDKLPGPALLAAGLFALLAIATGCDFLETETPRALIQPTLALTATATPTPTPGQPRETGFVMVRVGAPPPDIPKYDRKEWRHWTDADGDCQDARQEALVEESLTPVTFKTEDRCRVATGNWVGPYTGKAVDDPSQLDIDHMVPLANAHRSGGWEWDRDKKAAFANDLIYADHLIATTSAANRSKGADGPEEWRPPDRTYWCDYAVDWIAIKNRWGLFATEDERDALLEMLGTCETPPDLALTPAVQSVAPPPATPQPETPLPAATPTLKPTPTAAAILAPTSAPLPTDTPALTNTPRPTNTPAPLVLPTTAPAASLRYDPNGPDRNCGDFDTWQQAQDFFIAAGGPENDRHRLDGNNKDGIACQSLPGAPTPTPTPTPGPIPTPTTGPTPAPTPSGLRYDPGGPDRDCGDFDTWRQAQDFFIEAGGPENDRHRLDRNNDGTACESLPGAPTPIPAPTPGPIPTPTPAPTLGPPSGLLYDPGGPDRDCGDFDTWRQAQDFFIAAGGPENDRHRLDGNNKDGIACQSLPGALTPIPTPTPGPIPTPTPAPAPRPTPSGLRYDPGGPNRDCGDFATWRQAQDFFIAAGGPENDRHRLDRNNDGTACESLPGAPTPTPTPTPAPTPMPTTGPTPAPTPSGLRYDPGGPDRDCGDFATWRQAQDFFIAAGGPENDRHRLDGNNDGTACQSLPGAP